MSRERLTRIVAPIARAIETDDVLEQQATIRYAFGQDRLLRSDAIPQFFPPITYDWIDAGTVAVSLLLPSYFVPMRCQLRELRAHVITPPAGSSIIVDAETHDNETLGTVTIAAGDNYGTTVGLTVDITPGTWIRAEVQQVGSGTAGSNMTFLAVLYPLGYGAGSG